MVRINKGMIASILEAFGDPRFADEDECVTIAEDGEGHVWVYDLDAPTWRGKCIGRALPNDWDFDTAWVRKILGRTVK